MAKKVTDPATGVVYPSIVALARAYGVSADTVSRRLRDHISLEVALLPERLNRTLSRDHLGREYSSKREMFAAWGVPYERSVQRMLLGWSVERVLTTPDPIPPTWRSRVKRKRKQLTGAEHVL